MNFFDMGIGEILMIIVVALVIWGPGKIPKIAREIGRTLAMLKKTSQELTSQITKELDVEETKGISHTPPRGDGPPDEYIPSSTVSRAEDDKCDEDPED